MTKKGRSKKSLIKRDVSDLLVVVGLMAAYVGFIIVASVVDSVDATTSWNPTIADTIGVYIVLIGLLGVIGIAILTKGIGE